MNNVPKEFISFEEVMGTKQSTPEYHDT